MVRALARFPLCKLALKRQLQVKRRLAVGGNPSTPLRFAQDDGAGVRVGLLQGFLERGKR